MIRYSQINKINNNKELILENQGKSKKLRDIEGSIPMQREDRLARMGGELGNVKWNNED